MALIEVANTSCTVSHSSGSSTSGGSFTFTTPPSPNVQAEGGGVYRGPTGVSFSGGNSTEDFGGTGAITPGTVYGTATFTPSATKVSANGSMVLREGDSTTFITLFGTFVPFAPPNTPVPNTPLPPTDIEISDAGQTSVRGE